MTPEQWATIKHFQSEEFDSPDAPGSGLQMDFGFVTRLDTLRDRWGKPIHINSGFRTPAHNAMQPDAKPNSAHLRGKAADCGGLSGLEEAIRFAMLAAYLGFKRVGISKKGTYVHVDSDDTLPQQVVWFYGTSFVA